MTKAVDLGAIYTPETPDALRDGLYRGFYAHQNPPREPPKSVKDDPPK